MTETAIKEEILIVWPLYWKYRNTPILASYELSIWRDWIIEWMCAGQKKRDSHIELH